MKKLYRNGILDWLAQRGIIGTPAVGREPVPMRFNRASRRYQQALMLKDAAEPRRRKYEKRGAPGRASKGRAPLRK